jgi:hypothetical protein
MEAEKRAATVITKAREEADQVRQTVATLTAQAEDARSAALRSKLEAENLLEAQRATRGAGEDIVAAATAQAEEIVRDAEQQAAAKRREADDELMRARAEAEQVKTESEQQAVAVIKAAEEKAASLVADAGQDRPQVDDGDELAAMLAAAEQELAISEELRRQRAELDLREQELVERERALAARRQGEAPGVVPSRDVASPLDPLETLFPTEPVPAVTDDDDEDPAERLSALLEAAAPAATPAAEPVISGSEVDLAMIPERKDPAAPPEPVQSADHDAPTEPRSRMAWPTPNRLTDDEHHEPDADGEAEESDGAEDEKQSRYRSRSAQLPHLGNQAKSNMTTMANLRKKSRGGNH